MTALLPSLALGLSLLGSVGIAAQGPSQAMTWSRLSSLPDQEGFAGPFAGVSGDTLIVAGGANFPDKKPWEGGTKIWYDKVFALDYSSTQWIIAGRLPYPLGYGVSLTVKQGIVLIGGSDEAGHHAEVSLLRWDRSRLIHEPLAALPQPVANACGALVNTLAYVAGGISTPTATEALNTFYSLDVRTMRAEWTTLPTWPGRERMLAIAGTHAGAFYLFGGCALKADADDKPVREWLRDAYRFKPGEGWKRIADLPRVAVAAPSPALELNGKLLVVGGDDGRQVNTPPTEHKGFPRTVLAYDPRSDTWETQGEVPFSLVTTTTVKWKNRFIIPGGEARPGVRSTEVWSLRTR